MSVHREHHAATEEHTAALRAVNAEMRRQTDLAERWANHQDYEVRKFLVDVLSGQFGRGIVGRQRRFSWFERLAGRLVTWYVVLRSL